LGWKQYIPNKRARFGIKLIQLCESESAYIYNSIIYTGKGTTFHGENNSYPNAPALGLLTRTTSTQRHLSALHETQTNPASHRIPAQNLHSPYNIPIPQDMASALSEIQHLLSINDFLDMYQNLINIRDQLKNQSTPESRMFLFFNSVIAL
jgi:hypothetical protein